MSEPSSEQRKRELAEALRANPPTRFFYNVRGASHLFLRSLGKVTIRGEENMPTSGGFMVASNHRAHVDPPYITMLSARQMYYMGKEELFHGIVGFFVRGLEVFPVRRGEADRAAIRTAVDHIKNGHIVGIFPEGTRSSDRTLRQAEKGFGLIAKMTDCPIVPVAIEGTERVLPKGSVFIHRGDVTMTVGKPFTASEILAKHPGVKKEALFLIGQATMEAIQALMIDPVPIREVTEEDEARETASR
jgi:1-acyl-sn-glycerol-3-phosphate acyltransferase